MIKALSVVLLGLALCACESLLSELTQGPQRVRFTVVLQNEPFIFREPGLHVLREQAAYDSLAAQGWPEVWAMIEGEMQLRPPPAVDLTDSLLIAVQHGPGPCSHSGGGVASILRNGEVAVVTLEPLTALNPQCAADVWPFRFVRVSKRDLPEDVRIAFVGPAPGTD